MSNAAANGATGTVRRLPPEEFELKEIELHGHRVAYRAAGSGPVIVLVHGITSSSRDVGARDARRWPSASP